MRRITLNQGNGVDETDFERRLDRALAHAPVPVISPEFVVRVAAMVPARQLPRAPRFAYAPAAMIFCGVAMMVALLLLAPHAAVGSRFAIAVEWIVCVQLSVLAVSTTLAREFWPLR